MCRPKNVYKNKRQRFYGVKSTWKYQRGSCTDDESQGCAMSMEMYLFHITINDVIVSFTIEIKTKIIGFIFKMFALFSKSNLVNVSRYIHNQTLSVIIYECRITYQTYMLGRFVMIYPGCKYSNIQFYYASKKCPLLT